MTQGSEASDDQVLVECSSLPPLLRNDLQAFLERQLVSMKSATYSRPEKGDHMSTIKYEIEMLDFCYQDLIANLGKWGDVRRAWVCLEAFLLHYRNLIEFFGDEGDLKASKPEVWARRKLAPEEIASISNRKLCKKYRGAISAYLQHCTKIRAKIDRSWNVFEMYNEIKALIETFRSLFP
jgi:hypothetical protein